MTNQSVFITNVDQTYVELIQEILTDAGYRHVICHVGPDAFHRICNAQPDLVLLDSNLINPGRSWSTLDALRLHPKTRHLPVIICTTWYGSTPGVSCRSYAVWRRQSSFCRWLLAKPHRTPSA